MLLACPDLACGPSSPSRFRGPHLLSPPNSRFTRDRTMFYRHTLPCYSFNTFLPPTSYFQQYFLGIMLMYILLSPLRLMVFVIIYDVLVAPVPWRGENYGGTKVLHTGALVSTKVDNNTRSVWPCHAVFT